MTHVFVLGNASVDITLRVPRLPLPGETLLASAMARAPGGKGLNQAVVAARAGVPVHLCAPLGPGPEAVVVRTALAQEPFASLRLPEVEAPTDLSTLLVDDTAENCIVSTGDCAMALPAVEAEAFVVEMGAGDILLLQGNLSETVTVDAATLARARGARLVVNAAPLRWNYGRLLKLCDVVVANEGEAAELTGHADPARAAEALRGAGMAIVTLGPQGCVVADAAGVARLPAVATVVNDTSGGGDAFCGALVAAMALGATRPVDTALRAAALAVSRPGCFTAFPSRHEMAALLAVA
ncbi:Ribokinase [Rhodovastum atsumiense]|nr:ribokinase [Rhodovastum atsumiense]CAH2598591.1 Ribokinase [Rhodovastum atsumiense]